MIIFLDRLWTELAGRVAFATVMAYFSMLCLFSLCEFCPMNLESVDEVERDAYCVRLLKMRMHDNLLHKAEFHSDVSTYDGATSGAKGALGGFPCQVLLA